MTKLDFEALKLRNRTDRRYLLASSARILGSRGMEGAVILLAVAKAGHH